MPYLKPDDRKRLSLLASEIEHSLIIGPGDLNYLYTLINKRYLEIQGLSYQHLNDVVGAMESSKLEAYRRLAAPYEDVKIETNGEVYF